MLNLCFVIGFGNVDIAHKNAPFGYELVAIPGGTQWRRELHLASVRPICLFHKFVDGFTQVVDGGVVPCGDGIHHAVADVILQDHLAGVVQS